MLKRILLALALLTPTAAFAQQGGGVVLIPPITANDCAAWSSFNILKDAGAACGTGTVPAVVNGDVVTGTGTGIGDSAVLLTSLAPLASPTFTGTVTLPNSPRIVGSSTGYTALTSANSGASNFTLTLPAVTDTVAVLGTAQTWTAVQTFTNSDIALLGSSTGKTTFTSANSGASNFTLTFPAATDTVAVLGVGQTFTGANTFSNTTTVGGNVTAAFGTTGVGLITPSFTQTDTTTAPGTVATVYLHKFNGAVLATSSNAITVTAAYTADFEQPTQGANVTLTAGFAAQFNGRVNILGTTAMNNNSFTGVNTLSSNASTSYQLANVAPTSTVPTLIPRRDATTTGLGATAAGTLTGIAGATDVWESTSGGFFFKTITTGTNADFLCMAAGGLAQIQTSACTISSKRFKNQLGHLTDDALAAISKLPVVKFTLKQDKKNPNPDPNAGTPQAGLYAEDVAKIMPLCAIYENDMKTPKSYRQECVIAYLVKAVQQQQAEIAQLRARR